MPGVEQEIEFHDSDLFKITQDGPDLVLILSAYVHCWELPDGPGIGLNQSAAIRIGGATLPDPMPELPCRIWEGAVSTPDEVLDNMIPADYAADGPVTLRLDLEDGAILRIGGDSIRAELRGEGVVIEGLPDAVRGKSVRRPSDREAQAAWARIEALGGDGVWDGSTVSVSLAGTGITDDDLKLFDDFPYVEILSLNDTQVGDVGLDRLARIPALESLFIVNTRVSEEGIERFRRRRPEVKVRTEPSPKAKINPFTRKPL
jgi:hypothetical protein